ncbi:MAG: tetratricopeptide repeat protein [Bacteroidia bacterium]|nr:tetratricopeptide repeat protein [Bacteroidia bacterium]
MKGFLFLIIFLALTAVPIYAQNSRDSLELLLKDEELADTSRVLVLNELGIILLQMDSAKAVTCFNEAKKLSSTIEFGRGQAITIKNYGIVYEYAGNYKKALEYYEAALLLFKKINDSTGLAESYNNFGIIYYLQGIFDKALYYYLEAEKTFQKKNNPAFFSNILNNIGLIYEKQMQYDKALEYLKEALKIREENGLQNKLGSSYSNIGMVYQAKGLNLLALDYHLKAKKNREKYNDLKGLGATFNNIGDLYLQQKNSQLALINFRQSLEIKTKVGDKRGQAFALLGIAESYFQSGNYKECIRYAEQSLFIAEELNLKAHLVEVYTTLASVNEKLHHEKSAIGYLQKAIACKDSIYREKQRESIAELGVRFDLEKLHQEQQMMEVNILNQEKELSKASNIVKLQLVMVILVSIALLITTFLLYKLRKTVKGRDKLNKVKDYLISIISHDYRSPLTSIKSSLGLFAYEDITEEEKKHILSVSTNEIANTLNFLDNMLLWANAQLKGIKANKNAFKLFPVIESNMELLSPQARHKKIKLIVEGDTGTEVYADRDMINTVLRNLISNSIKFSNEDSEIKIHTSVSGRKAIVHIIDQGVGIRQERIPFLFNFDEATPTYGTGNEKGIGLGLSLCKDFIEQNDGEISVTSVFGQGSDFCITIPLNSPDKF